MKTKGIMHIFTRTPLHVGAGNSVGVVDSPIQRERHTKFPIIPGSSLKGVLADLFNEISEENKISRSDIGNELFGTGENAGNLLIGEAKILAFPVRSAKGAFAWITCPLVLTRYQRDVGCTFELKKPSHEKFCLATKDDVISSNDGKVILEEYCFEVENSIDDSVVLEFKKIKLDIWENSVNERLVVVNDEIFAYFVENACEVVTRICVDDETGVVKKGALFNQEQVPSEAMFYAPIREQKEKGSYLKLKSTLENNSNVIQVGGDATIGLGYCSVNFSNIEGEVQ